MKNVWKQMGIMYSCTIACSAIVLFLAHYIFGVDAETVIKLMTGIAISGIPAVMVAPWIQSKGWSNWILRTVDVAGVCACYEVFSIVTGDTDRESILRSCIILGVEICIVSIGFYVGEKKQKKQMKEITAKLQEQADE